MDKEKIGPALGKLPSGVYIVTSILDGEEIGMLASFVEQRVTFIWIRGRWRLTIVRLVFFFCFLCFPLQRVRCIKLTH